MVSLTIDVDRTKGANSKSRSDSNGANSNEAGNRLIFSYVHPGINKGSIPRKHISLLWVFKEGHNEQTISFPKKWCVFFIVARNQRKR